MDEMDRGLNGAPEADSYQAEASGAVETAGEGEAAVAGRASENGEAVASPEGITGAAAPGTASENGEAVASPEWIAGAAAEDEEAAVAPEGIAVEAADGAKAMPEADAPEGDGMDESGEAGGDRFRAEREALILRAEGYARQAVEGEARAAAALLGVPEKRLGHVAKLAALSGIDPADGEARAKIGRAVRAVLVEFPELGGAGTGRAAPVSRIRRDAFARGFLGE